MSETLHEMVIYHACCLHIGVADGWSDESETSRFEVLAHCLGFGCGAGNFFQGAPAILNGVTVDKTPDIVMERAEFVLHFEISTRVVDRRFDFSSISDDILIR